MKKKSQIIQTDEIECSEDISESLPYAYDNSIIDEIPQDFTDGTAGFIKLPIGAKKIKRYFSIILIGLLFLFIKIFYLQIIEGNYYRALAEGNRIKIKTVEAKRGIIYDRNNEQLVENIPNLSLTFTPANLPKNENQKDEIIKIAANILEESPETLKQKIENISKDFYFQPKIIKENLDQTQAIQFILKAENLSGFDIEIASVRKYLKSVSLSIFLGYTGRISKEELKNNQNYGFNDYIGKTGLEFYYEKILRGKYGLRQIEVDALGRENKIIAQEEPIAGSNLILSLDQKLQEKVEETITSHLKKIGKKRAVVAILNPQNGEILSLASSPFFDNNEFARGLSPENFQKIEENPDQPLFNRPISGTYPSGSIIKPIIAAAALEEKIIDVNTQILSSGGIRIGEWFFPDWKAGGHGLTNVKRALAESINTFFYVIGGGYQNHQGLGVEKINHYALLFGLNNTLGIDLPNENAGLVPDPSWKEKTKGEKWYIGDTYHLAIGQGDILVTPLQVASYTAVFANQGILYQPHLVKNIVKYNGETIQEIKPKIIRQNFIDKKNLQIVSEGLRQAVTTGSARLLNSLPVKVAGKTGTAQWSNKKSPHAWFTGFAPYENPSLVITILVEEGGEGSSTAVPIAYDILNWYFSENKGH